MNIDTLPFLKFNKKSELQLKTQVNERKQRIIGSNFNINCYPQNYYLNQISFGFKSKLSANDLIAKIGEENFPNREIVKKLRNLDNSNDFSLYDIHLEYYKNLINCSTLEEAKQKYPEFKDVIDAKDVDYKSQNKLSAICKIANKEILDVDIKDLSLELLKKYYGKLQALQKQESYYNFGHATLGGLFKLLNIKKMDNNYIVFAIKSNDKIKEKMSNALKGQKRSLESRKKMSESQKGQKKSPETRKKMSEAQKGQKRSPETRKRMSEAKKIQSANPEFIKKMEIYWEIQRLANKKYPEFTSMMSDIVKLYPGLPKIINKSRRGIPLTETEEVMIKTYFKECALRMPGYKKIIGKEYHNILVEQGIIEEKSKKELA